MAADMPDSIFGDLEEALDEESWEWLLENNERIAKGVRRAVQRGARPVDVKRFVLGKTRRDELALRCEQGGAHVKRQLTQTED
jgi:hypothetical protein